LVELIPDVQTRRTRWASGRRRASPGFTLIELVLVLLIMATAAALVGPELTKRFTTADPRRVIVQVRAAMELMRVQAVQSGREEVLVVAPRDNKYWHEGGSESATVDEESGLLAARGLFVREEGEVEFRFYPDGTNSGGEVWIEKERMSGVTLYRLALNPLLGTVIISRED
jgi:general secretion pathway protein H